jgi:hypothetical protein
MEADPPPKSSGGRLKRDRWAASRDCDMNFPVFPRVCDKLSLIFIIIFQCVLRNRHCYRVRIKCFTIPIN